MYIVLKYETRNSKLTRDRQKLEIKINISWGSILPNTTIKKKKTIKKLKIPKRGSFRSDLDRNVAQDFSKFNLRTEKNERLLPCREQRKYLTSREQIVGLRNGLFPRLVFNLWRNILARFHKYFPFYSQSNLLQNKYSNKSLIRDCGRESPWQLSKQYSIKCMLMIG